MRSGAVARQAAGRRTFRSNEDESRGEIATSLNVSVSAGGASADAAAGRAMEGVPRQAMRHSGQTFIGSPFMLRVASPVPTLPSRKVGSRASIVASSAGYRTMIAWCRSLGQSAAPQRRLHR